MLRTLVPTESQLVQLCNTKSWTAARIRALSHPEEAAPSSSARRGTGTTALAIAVRSNAPLDTVRAITEANIEQLVQVVHTRRGTVLHEAIRHRASLDVINYLVDVMVQYEQQLQREGQAGGHEQQQQQQHQQHQQETHQPKYDTNTIFLSSIIPSSSASSEEDSAAKNHSRSSTSLFNHRDDLGKTPLHHMIDRTTRDIVRYNDGRYDIMETTSNIIEAYPPAVNAYDFDGHTPLLLVLIMPSFIFDMEIEFRVLELVQLLVRAYPIAALGINKEELGGGNNNTTGIQYRFHGNHHRWWIQNDHKGSISPNPLSYALMYGRSVSIVKLLLDTTESLSSKMKNDGEEENACAENSTKVLGDITGGDDTEKPSSLLTRVNANNDNDDDNDDHDNDYHRHNNEERVIKNRSCTELVSNDLEVPLHIACTMRAPKEVLSLLLLSNQYAAATRDKYGLTPLHWVWIRHVIDRLFVENNDGGGTGGNVNGGGGGGGGGGTMLAFTSTSDSSSLAPPPPPVKASKRRYIPVNYMQLLHKADRDVEEMVSNSDAGEVEGFDSHTNKGGEVGTTTGNLPNEASGNTDVKPEPRRPCYYAGCGIDSLWEKAGLLLPATAEVAYSDVKHKEREGNIRKSGNDTKQSSNPQWPLVHAASYLSSTPSSSCPRSILLLAIHHHPNQMRQRDVRGNLPVHYASERVIRASTLLPLGVSQTHEGVLEKSAVYDILERFPYGARITNKSGRLPLHIAIDAEKVRTTENSEVQEHHRHHHHHHHEGDNNDDDSPDVDLNDSPSSVIMYILRHHSEALERRDSQTMLYPFMQAAAGEGACLNTVFLLLKEGPTLVSSALN